MCECQRPNVVLDGKSKNDFEKIQEFLNMFDPCGLISLGAPEDEYDCLTIQLLSSIYNRKTKTEIKELILHEIEFHFGTPDLEILEEPYKTNFYNDLETFIDKLKQHFEKGMA
jgi:hypothetical protein